MKLRHLFISSVIALSLTSCITDNSTEASSDTSLLSLEHPIENIITLNRWDTLTLAPKVLQTNQQKKSILSMGGKLQSCIYCAHIKVRMQRSKDAALPTKNYKW